MFNSWKFFSCICSNGEMFDSDKKYSKSFRNTENKKFVNFLPVSHINFLGVRQGKNSDCSQLYCTHDLILSYILYTTVNIFSFYTTVCRWLAAGRSLSLGTPNSSTDKIDRQYIYMYIYNWQIMERGVKGKLRDFLHVS